MFKPRRTLILFVGFLVGCGCFPMDSAQLAPLLPGTPTVGDVSSDNILDPNTPALDSPAANAAPIRVRLSNPTERNADCQVTMQLIGREVHFSLRRILATTQSLVIGPDQADIVRIEAVFLGQPPAAMEPRVLHIGQDFDPGEIIEFVLALPTDGGKPEIPPDDQGDDQGPPPPTIAIEGLDQDVFANPGELVTFDVVTANAGDEARIAVFADPDANPENDNELAILDDAPAATHSTIVWNTTAVPPGTYTVLAELRHGDDVINAEPAPGHVIIVALPPSGACCYPEGTCEIVTEEACVLGEWLGPDTDCADCPACIVLCPPDATGENEPCGEDTNGGCWSATARFEPIACGQTVCGTVWLEPWDPNDGDYLDDPNDPNELAYDIDWYELVFTEDTQFTFTVQAEFPVMAAFMAQFEAGVPGCENVDGIFEFVAAFECEESSLSMCVGPGTYYVIVLPFPEYMYEVACGGSNDYTATLDCQSCTYTDGACCFGLACEVMSEVECFARGGEYQGDETGCDPNPCITCPGDLNGDDGIDLSDVAQLLANYGTTSGASYEDGDRDADGDVDLSDLSALLSVYGTTCE